MKEEKDPVQFIVNLLNEPFSEDELSSREGRGGETYSYININDIIKRLNRIWKEYPQYFSWDWNVISFKTFEKEETSYNKYTKKSHDIFRTYAVCHGRVTFNICGKIIVKDGMGGSDMDCGNIGDNVKSAESDALKKAVSRMGVGLQVYGKGSGGSSKKKAIGNKF